jgi:hypothetical protein
MFVTHGDALRSLATAANFIPGAVSIANEATTQLCATIDEVLAR